METSTVNISTAGSVTHDFPLWHQYLLVGISIALQKAVEYPLLDLVQTLNIQFAFISKTRISYMEEREVIAALELDYPAWVATGPCGAARHSSDGKDRNHLVQIKIAVNVLFYVNITVLQQMMAYVHPDSNTSCVVMATGDWKIKYKKCGTGGKYYHLIEHHVAYIDIRYNEMNDTVFVAFMYQVTDAEAVNNKYFLPDFIGLSTDPNVPFSSTTEALEYKGRRLVLWTFSSLIVLRTVSVYSHYHCRGVVVGHNKASVTIWDGTEITFITVSGIFSDLTMLHYAELCGDDHKLVGETKEFVASGSIGSLTIGLDYRNTTPFLLYMYIYSQDFVCTLPLCTYVETALPTPQALSPHESFFVVLANTSQVHRHLIYSRSERQYPVLIVNKVAYESSVPFNTSTCRLGSLHIDVPGYIKTMTFCSDVQLRFLLKSATFGGIHFTRFAYFVIKNYGQFGRISINYTLSLSHCEGIINICDKIPAPTDVYRYENVDLEESMVTRKKYSCLVIYNFPSDTLYEATECHFLAKSTYLYDRNNLTLHLSDTVQGQRHPLCDSSVVVSVDDWKMRQEEQVMLSSPIKYETVDFWYKLTLFSNCPAMGSYMQLYLEDASSGCDVKRTIAKVLPLNELMLYCGITEIPGVKGNPPSQTWILELTRSSYATDFRKRCCRMSVSIDPLAPSTCSLSDAMASVVFREVFLRNDSFVEMYFIWYYVYPSKNVSFAFFVRGAAETQKIIISATFNGNSPCSLHGSDFGFIVKHQQFHSDTYVSPFLLAPILSFGEYYPINNISSASWWHACNKYRCYWYDTRDGVSWAQAEAVCRSKGGHLFSLNTENELEGLRDWAGTGISRNFSRYNTRNIYYRAEIFKKRLVFLGLQMDHKVTIIQDSSCNNSVRSDIKQFKDQHASRLHSQTDFFGGRGSLNLLCTDFPSLLLIGRYTTQKVNLRIFVNIWT